MNRAKVGVGNKYADVVSTVDSLGRDAAIPRTAFGDIRTAELHPQFQNSFEYTVDNADLTEIVEVGGTVTQADAMAVVSTGASANGMAMITSVRHAKYRAGLGGLARFTALFTTPVAATEQLVGLVDEMGSSEAFKNGYMIGFVGTVFGFHRFQNDVLTTVAQSEWDDKLDGTGRSGMTLDQTMLNVFDIQYQYLGAGAITLHVEDPSTGLLIEVHQIKYANLNTEPSVHNPNFHFTIHADNKDVATDLIIKSSSYAYFIEGKTSHIELHQPHNSSGEQTKGSVQAAKPIFTIRNRATYASKVNFIDVVMENIGASIEASSANNLGSVSIIMNATLGGSPSWANIETDNSVVEIDTAATTATNGKELFTTPLAGKNDRTSLNLVTHELILQPGETITVVGLSVNSATIKASLLWKELF